MKVYTKTGDDGTTGILGGTRLTKSHIRIEAYGTVDELLSWIGMVRDQEVNSSRKDILVNIQDRLFTLGSYLASDPVKSKVVIPEIKEEDIKALELEMDQMDEKLPPLRNFVLPGGHQSVSYVHIARTVCRRAERAVVLLNENQEVNSLVIQYLNRLSDYLFVLSRMNAHELNAEETPWVPKK
ncbi:cob(I)yrinic acid a,c-diamide adenosyltransferase [Marinigracilibium pacificum]|uniref:Corrinoid adenosyltransferase n=1 Tax=Marinigracilibium pacificum TaxID=2729599 RepID=A0A848J2T0_9BACT|nr:cob(I)yrinic acid a,c-diamide adenosyltransferase [Marinigracilibium pacificum]NMM48794.1 cob(I)yrinic acid a,c-diamide adenosyltransferase [Marinigracilibium pacificum]